MTKSNKYAATDDQFVMPTFARSDVAFVEGRGMYLQDAEGASYLDLLAGIAVMGLGHSDPAVTATLQKQAAKLVHTSNYFYCEHRGALAELLVDEAGFDGQVFFSNSGAEANECAIKLARKWAHAQRPAADILVTARGSFHGRTLATVAATGQPVFSEPFAPVMPGFSYVPYNDISALEDVLDEHTFALMLEVVQGESGVWPADRAYLAAARRLCDERGILLILDEVQTGICRAGTFFAYQRYGIVPDIVTAAKALGNGYPIGATIARRDLAACFAPGDHGTTFGGSELACAVALTTLQRHRALDTAARAAAVGAYARAQLAAVPGVEAVRGLGLMIGCTVAGIDAHELVALLLDRHIVANAIGSSHIRIIPPLICEKTHIDIFIAALYDIMNAFVKE